MMGQIAINGRMASSAPDEAVVINKLARHDSPAINGMPPAGVNINGLSRPQVLEGCIFDAPLWHPALGAATFKTLDASKLSLTASAPLWTPRGRWFDQVDDYIFNDTTAFTTTPQATVEEWLYVVGGYGVYARFFKTVPESLAIWASGDKFTFVIEYGGALQKAATSSTNIPVGSWVHVVGTYDGATLLLYESLVLKATVTQAGAIDVATSSLSINGGGATTRWKGYCGECRIYSRALSFAEIARSYYATRWRYQ